MPCGYCVARLPLRWSRWGILGLGLTAGNKATAQDNLSQNIHDYVADKLDDFTATMRVDHYDEHEGEKINKDFGYIYKLKGDVENPI